MATTYEKCGDEVDGMIRELVKKHHSELFGVGIRIGCLFAFNPKNDNPVKFGGYPETARLRIVPLKERAQGLPDAEIVIDRKKFNDLTEPQQRASLDHVLQHIELKTKKKSPAFDDLDRPKLKIRLHDYHTGGFYIIAERHGDASGERHDMKFLSDNYGQMLFGWTAKGLAGAAKKKFGDALESIEDGPDGPVLSINMDKQRDAVPLNEAMGKRGRAKAAVG